MVQRQTEEQGGSKFIVDVVTGKEPLMEKGGSELEMTAFLYLTMAVSNDVCRRTLREHLGADRFKALIAERIRAVIPVLLKHYLKRPTLYGAESYIRFIVEGCRLINVPIDEYVTLETLKKLRHEVHLRSAVAAKKKLGTNEDQPARGQIAGAVMAGVTLREIGVSSQKAAEYIDQYYCRTSSPELWGKYRQAYAEINNLLGVSIDLPR